MFNYSTTYPRQERAGGEEREGRIFVLTRIKVAVKSYLGKSVGFRTSYGLIRS